MKTTTSHSVYIIMRVTIYNRYLVYRMRARVKYYIKRTGHREKAPMTAGV